MSTKTAPEVERFKSISFSLTPEMIAGLKELCQSGDTDRSKLIRELIRREMKQLRRSKKAA